VLAAAWPGWADALRFAAWLAWMAWTMLILIGRVH
jgi:hypothetical protein